MPASKTKATVATVEGRKTHFVSAKLTRKIRANKGGYGIFANRTIAAGELLVVWGGDIVTGEELVELPALMRRHSIQVEENLYMVSQELPEVGDFINHSCSPNAGLSGQLTLVAIRTINSGQEVCYDYAMSDGSAYDEFQCSCGSQQCRGAITGSDWALPDLQARYFGFFSPYLQRRIDEMRAVNGAAPDKPDLSVVPDIESEVL